MNGEAERLLVGAPYDNATDGASIEQLFDGAILLGGELDERFRVLSVTLELTDNAWAAIGVPRAPIAGDRRVQTLCHPVSVLIASMRLPRERRVLTFDTEALTDVMATVAGAKLHSPVLGRNEPRPGTWGPKFSVVGQSNAPDGRTQRATFSVTTDDAEFDLFVRFDVLEVRNAAGDILQRHPQDAIRPAFAEE